MTISLTGIIWVQVYWIHNSIKVKQAQFDQLVAEALNHAISVVGDDESINFIHEQLVDVVALTDSSRGVSKHIKKWHSQKTLIDSSNTENSFNYEVITDSDGEDVKMTISINGNDKVIDINDKAEKIEAILSNDSITDIIDISEEDFTFANRFGKIIVKMAKEFKEIDKPIHHLLEQTNLKEIVEESLKDNGIELPFTYAIISGDEVIEEFSSDQFELHNDIYTISLFKNHLLDNSALLAIDFTGKRNYVFKSMQVMILCSVLFTLIILLTFISTLHYMFKQKRLSEMKSDFINNMTHEFKTPISTISLAIDSITHPKIIDNKKQIHHFADVIRKENQRMNRQVESVLNTALGEKGELDIDKKEFNFNELLQRIPERMKLQLEANSATLKLNLFSSRLYIVGDEMHLQNTICNLIDNAIKYNKNKPNINITTDLVNAYCVITVADNGIGMNNETQKKVFDKFYRVEKGNIHTTKGFGIGLSYVKAIVTAHQGTIKVNSKPNSGTSITIYLPLSK